MTGQQLKNSILQEAIQGRLVPQIATEEPAIRLLECIHREKGELAKAGRIKKADLFVEPISEDECPFEKPSGWEFARLSELSLDSADGPFGSNLKKEHYTDQKQVRIIQLSNIGELGWRDSNVKYTTFEHLKTVSRSEAFAGDIIIAKMMPAGRAIICPNTDTKYVLSSDAVRFAFSTLLDRRYLYYAINSPVFKDQVYGEVQGITRVRTSLSKLRTYILPIPPLSEQKRIVEKIDELLPLVDEYDKASGELEALNKILPDKLRKSVLQEAIHGTLVPNDIPEGEANASELLRQILKERQDKENREKGKKAKKLTLSTIEEEPWELPEGWCWCRGKDIFFPMESTKPKSDFVYIDTDAVNNKKNIIDNPKSVLLKDAPSRATRKLHANDILFSMVRPYLKNIAYVDERFSTAIGTTGFYVITTSPVLYQPYIFKMMLSDYVVSGLTEFMKGDNSPSINNGHIEEFLYPLPPVSIQKAIVAKIEEVFAAIDKLQA